MDGDVTFKQYKLMTPLVWLLGFCVVVVMMPFTWLLACYKFFKWAPTDYDTFTIGPLSTKNIETLIQLGFYRVVGNVSTNNIEYTGYRLGEIVVQDNGRCFIKHRGKLKAEEKFMKNKLKRLPTLARLERLKRDLKDYEESLITSAKYTEERIYLLKKEIEEVEGEMKP